jgi:hypothetical protein
MLKKIQSLFVLCVFISHSSTAHFSLDATPYQAQAQTWCSTYVCTTAGELLISEHDLITLANLCYLSCMRSYNTLTAQDASLQALSALWHGWQNITQTRLDPSHQLPYNIPTEEQAATGERFWRAQHAHHRAGLTYARAVEHIVHGNELHTAHAVRSVSELRVNARVVMAQALLDVKEYLGSIFNTESTKGFYDLWKGFCFIKHLASYTSQLALTTLASAEELNNTVSETGWSALEAVQVVGAHTWRAIEQARASFYLAHYNTIATIIQQRKLRAPLMFDVNGLLPKNKQTILLPTHLLLTK